jgi:hypothetical protein
MTYRAPINDMLLALNHGAGENHSEQMIGYESDINSLSTERAQQRKCVLVLPTEAA